MSAVEVPQTLEYKGGQLNVAPVLEEENLVVLALEILGLLLFGCFELFVHSLKLRLDQTPIDLVPNQTSYPIWKT
ncbi:hypothetical protein Tco_1271629 [Tanacetum coccineum]